MPEAAPARSGGALPTISSVVKLNTGANASEMAMDAGTTSARPEEPPTWVSSARPMAATARAALSTNPGRKRCTKRGARFDPTMNPTAEGSDHRPACNGERPSTSCRYCATNRKYPTATKMASTLVASDTLKVGNRKRSRSIKGSASLRCRRRNRKPMASPTTMEATGGTPKPSWAICLRP